MVSFPTSGVFGGGTYMISSVDRLSARDAADPQGDRLACHCGVGQKQSGRVGHGSDVYAGENGRGSDDWDFAIEERDGHRGQDQGFGLEQLSRYELRHGEFIHGRAIDLAAKGGGSVFSSSRSARRGCVASAGRFICSPITTETELSKRSRSMCVSVIGRALYILRNADVCSSSITTAPMSRRCSFPPAMHTRYLDRISTRGRSRE